MITMTRRMTFSAGKNDWPGAGMQTEGRAGFDTSTTPETYGHNYVLDVSVAGEIDVRTGIVVNIKEIERVVRELVIDRFDGKLLQKQAPELRDRPVTPELLALWIAGALRDHLPKEAVLTAVRLEETPLVSAEWRAAEQMKPKKDIPSRMLEMRSTQVFEFSASHRLHSAHLSDEENVELFGKCNYPNGHGHNYILEVTVAGPLDDRSGRVIRPDALEEIVHRVVIDRYDHRHLNYDIPEFKDLVPSTEVVTKMIWERLVDEIPAPVRLASILVRETARSIFEYRGEE